MTFHNKNFSQRRYFKLLNLIGFQNLSGLGAKHHFDKVFRHFDNAFYRFADNLPYFDEGVSSFKN